MLVTFSGQMLDKFLEHIHGCGPASGILHEADRPCLTELISQSPGRGAWHTKGWWKEWMGGLCWPGLCFGKVLVVPDIWLAPESIRRPSGVAKEILLLC